MDVSALLALLAGLLIVFQYVTLDKLGVLRPGLRYHSLQGFLSVVSRFVSINLFDVSLLLLIVAAGMLLVFIEWRWRRLSVFFEHIFARERRTVVFLVLGSLVLVRFYFAEGEFSHGADTYLHVAYAWLAATSMAQGEVPIWTHYFCNGTPYLQFYGFLFYYLVGLVNLAFQAPFWSIKFVLGAGHALSGLGAYLFVRRLTGSRQAGFAAGLAYVLSFLAYAAGPHYGQAAAVAVLCPAAIAFLFLGGASEKFEPTGSGHRRRRCVGLSGIYPSWLRLLGNGISGVVCQSPGAAWPGAKTRLFQSDTVCCCSAAVW